MSVIEDVKDMAQSLETISANGASIVSNANSVTDSLKMGGERPTIMNSTTKQILWFVVGMGFFIIILVWLAAVKWHTETYPILPYVVAIVTPTIITYGTKSYLEKKNLGGETVDCANPTETNSEVK